MKNLNDPTENRIRDLPALEQYLNQLRHHVTLSYQKNYKIYWKSIKNIPTLVGNFFAFTVPFHIYKTFSQ